jgi:hypothetical protein
MDYIWEKKNTGNDLHEMAFIKRKMLIESGENIAAGQQPEEIVLAVPKNQAGVVEGFLKDKGVEHRLDTEQGRLVVSAKALANPSAKAAIDELKKRGIVSDGTPNDDERAIDENRQKVITEILSRFPKEIHDTVGFGIRQMLAGNWFDGSTPNEAQQKMIALCRGLVSKGSTDDLEKLLNHLGFLVKSGKFRLDSKNQGLYRETAEKKAITTHVRMPAFFESEPDDSMWDDIVVNAFGIGMVNLNHPVVNKIIHSENPEDECPGDLKTFKKAIYGDKRMTAVFGEGGIARMLGKLANLCTLGIAGKTVDAGKRADRIIKELAEKGGRIVHRNLLLVDYDDIVNADPDNDELAIEVDAYNRSKRTYIPGTFSVPAAALANFYSVVDPIESSKIYVEMYMNHDTAKRSLHEAEESDDNALLEGRGVFGRIAQGARNVQDKFTRGENKATAPAKHGNDELAAVKERFIATVQKLGHPPFYVLKGKSANREVDVISTSATGQAGTTGGKVYMVTMSIGSHKAAMFMTPNEIKHYFSA